MARTMPCGLPETAVMPAVGGETRVSVLLLHYLLCSTCKTIRPPSRGCDAKVRIASSHLVKTGASSVSPFRSCCWHRFRQLYTDVAQCHLESGLLSLLQPSSTQPLFLTRSQGTCYVTPQECNQENPEGEKLRIIVLISP